MTVRANVRRPCCPRLGINKHTKCRDIPVTLMMVVILTIMLMVLHDNEGRLGLG